MNHSPLFLIRYGVVMTVLLITMTGLTVQAAEPEHVGLTPAQRQQVQAVGHAILASRRHAKRSAESEAMRKQINLVKIQLDALIAPIPAGKITLAPTTPAAGSRASAMTPEPMSAQDKIHAWRQAYAPRLAGLGTEIQHLETQSTDLLNKRRPSKSGLWQQLRALIVDTPPSSTKHGVVTSLSDAALIRLGSLQGEIDAALALPEAERHQHLLALSKRLNIHKHFRAKETGQVLEHESRSPEVETPTLTSRTTHRRQF
ncbi:MAG TPA: hypothetical protein ENI98_05555 [Gammaproteobacteria bacterium]|nr:hypothetical protein [Gammaproteobacteria bacterium]